MRDRWERLEDQLKLDPGDDEVREPIGFWDPSRPDRDDPTDLRGHLVWADWAAAKFGQRVVLTVITEQGPRLQWWLHHSRARKEIVRVRPAPRSPILIRYGGAEPRPDGDGVRFRWKVAAEETMSCERDLAVWVTEFQEEERKVREGMK